LFGREKLSGGQESQTKGQPQWATAEAAKWRAKGTKKGYSHDMLLKENRAKSSSKLKHLKGQKAARKRKAPWLKKGKTLTLSSKLAVADGGGVDGDEVVDE
jgi:hypothetical protein